ncbi:hypothetical protein J6590_085417 [Homalodisca vitripennis]|nr:hypothetical protein J6590_085417 [Homalodisca vitripennis]
MPLLQSRSLNLLCAALLSPGTPLFPDNRLADGSNRISSSAAFYLALNLKSIIG